MNKQKLIPVLSALLALQLVLAAGVRWAGSADDSGPTDAKLIAVDFSKIDGLKIEDGQSSVELNRVDQIWRVPEFDFPASPDKVQGFLDKLAGLKEGWPVGTSGDAAKRFKVAGDEFERKITLTQGGKAVATLYMGTSPGYRLVHVRLDGSDEIHAVELSTYDASDRGDDWIDKDFLKQPLEQLQRVSWRDFALEKHDDKWALAGIAASEQTNQEQATQLLQKITALRVDGVLGKEDKPEYGLNQPDLVFSYESGGGQKVTYNMKQLGDENYYVVKSSADPHYVKVSKYVIKPILDTTRDNLVEPAGQAADTGTAKP